MMTEQNKCQGIDCAWCANPECPNEKKQELDREMIAEKFIKAYNKHLGDKYEKTKIW